MIVIYKSILKLIHYVGQLQMRFVFTDRSIEDGEKLLRTAWEKASTLECENGLLLQAMIHRCFAAMYCS